jgi:hypothetical protein
MKLLKRHDFVHLLRYLPEPVDWVITADSQENKEDAIFIAQALCSLF